MSIHRGKPCVYCGNESNTDEHVFPRSLFQPGANNLITVPGCLVCNGEKGKDDTYFRDVLTLSMSEEELDSFHKITNRSIRGMTRPEAEAYGQNIINSIQEEPAFENGGFYSRTRLRMTVDEARIEKSIFDIQRGLILHHNKHYAGEITKQLCFDPGRVHDRFPEAREQTLRILAHMKASNPIILGSQEVVYWFESSISSGLHEAASIIQFYRSHWFAIATIYKAK